MLLQLQHITKQFPGVKALSNVSLEIKGGEVHALCGENGAGKSTLMNILSGNLGPTSGTILKNGAPLRLESPLDAQANGIAIVHQERSLFEELNIAENIFAGQHPVSRFGFIDYKQLYAQTKALLAQLHLQFLLPQTPVKQLSVAHQQMVEIAKALSKTPSILILDEPTASITQKEVDVLFAIIRDLKTKGVAIIYISHRLQEIFAIADRVSVLKDGKYIGTKGVKETTSDELIRMMVGRDIQTLKKTNHASGEVVLEVKNLNGRNFKNISFSLHRGEIAGFAGLIGSGRTEIARAVFGADTYLSGTISIRGKTQFIHHTNEGIAAGIAYLPEERKTSGVFLDMTIEENVVSANLSLANKNSLFSHVNMTQIARDNIKKFGIAAHSPKQQVRNLSGGNQQKVVLAKWLLLNADILIVDEPTHGVDVGARFEIYELLQQEAASGKAILLISSDMPELLMLSDTIYILYKGIITKRLSREEATEEKIMHYAAGVE